MIPVMTSRMIVMMVVVLMGVVVCFERLRGETFEDKHKYMVTRRVLAKWVRVTMKKPEWHVRRLSG